MKHLLSVSDKGGRMVKSRFFTWPKFIILLLILVLAFMGLWIAMRNAIVSGIESQINNYRREGYEINLENFKIDGFPIRLDTHASNISIRTPANNNIADNWAIKTSDLQISSATLTPLSWDIKHRGNLRIDMRGIDGARYLFDINPAKIDGVIATNMQGRLKLADLYMENAQLDALVGTPPVISRIGNIRINITSNATKAKAHLQANNLLLSPASQGMNVKGMFDEILGRSLSKFSIKADIENFDLLQQNNWQNWQSSGGAIKNGSWELLWGIADIKGDFEIEFVGNKPQGSINIAIKDPQELIDKLSSNGLLSEQQTELVSKFLQTIKQDKDGRKQISLGIKDGKVNYGFMTLYEF